VKYLGEYEIMMLRATGRVSLAGEVKGDDPD
jgi:hypothetical protein